MGEDDRGQLPRPSPVHIRTAFARVEEARATLTTGLTPGSLAVPFMLGPIIVVTNSGSMGTFRRICRVETLNNSNQWHGPTSTGITASFVAELTESSDNAPRLPPRYHGNGPAWLSNYTWQFEVRQFASGSAPQSSTFWTDIGGANPPLLLSYPYYGTSGGMTAPLSTSTASNDDILILMDWSAMVVVDRVGLEVVMSDWVAGASGRPKGARGVYAFWRTSSGIINTDAGRLLRV